MDCYDLSYKKNVPKFLLLITIFEKMYHSIIGPQAINSTASSMGDIDTKMIDFIKAVTF